MLQGMHLDVAMQARLDYIARLREAENARVTAELIQDVEERLRVTREKFDAGRVPRFYVLRDEAELANAVQMDAMARSRAELAMVSLKTTLGVDLSSPITLVDRLEFEPVIVSIDEGVQQAREAPRPEGRGPAAGSAPSPTSAPPMATTSPRSRSDTCTTGP